MSLISHIELNVSQYRTSIQFYDLIFPFMGLTRLNCTQEYTAYTDGCSKIILCPTGKQYLPSKFHRKKSGINHLALYGETKEKIDEFYRTVMIPNSIQPLYKNGPFGDDDYYAVFFEDPDRLKLEFVCAPNYCSPDHWPNTLPNNFDPYG